MRKETFVSLFYIVYLSINVFISGLSFSWPRFGLVSAGYSGHREIALVMTPGSGNICVYLVHTVAGIDKKKQLSNHYVVNRFYRPFHHSTSPPSAVAKLGRMPVTAGILYIHLCGQSPLRSQMIQFSMVK
jgi:hypothetical protein